MQHQVARSSEVVEGQCHALTVEGTKVLLTRVNGQVQALENKCAHMGLPLHKGKLVDGVLQCPWHGAKFDACSGRNVEWVQNLPGGIKAPKFLHKVIAMGKQPAPLRTFAAHEKDGQIFVEL